ncbi:MAG: M28 family peptidase [Planctomycetes bacterium]|nr:M28 family peptidase [Planctomycetota bacterium]
MRNVALLGACMAAAACQPLSETTPLAGVEASPRLGTQALAHARRLTEFGPRHTGSTGWRQGTDYIVRQLRRAGYEPKLDRWTDEAEGIDFVNVSAVLPGEYEDRIVIGCHHDTKCTTGHDDPAHNYHFVGANDSGSGVGLVLALAEELRASNPVATVEFVFFDGEESIPYRWNDARALFGSRRYVDRYTEGQIRGGEPPVRAFVLLDMVGAEELTIDRETRSTPALLDIIGRAARACGHERYFFEHSLDVTDDHVPFLRAGIPAVDLIDIADNPQWHTPHDTIDVLSADSLQIVGEVVLTALPEITRRFVVDRARTRR